MSKEKKENAFLKAVKNIVSKPGGSVKNGSFKSDFLTVSAKIFDRLSYPYLIIGEDAKVYYCNSAFFNFTSSKETPQNLSSITDKQDFKDLKDKFSNVFSFEDSVTLPLKLKINKTELNTNADISFLYEEDGVKYAAVSLTGGEASDTAGSEDISKSRNYLQILFSTMPTALYVRDKKGKIVMSNAPASKILGMDENRDKAGVLDKSSLKKDLERDEKIFKTGTGINDEAFAYKDLSGKDCIAHVIKAPVQDENGKISTVLTLFEDITNRKHQENEVLRNRNLLESILNHAPMAIYTRNSNGNMTFWNKKTIEMFEDEDYNTYDGAHKNQTKADHEGYKTREYSIIKDGKVAVYPQEAYTTREGNKLTLHLIKVPLPAVGNDLPGVLTIAQDITERHIQEQEMVKTQNILQTIFNNAPIAIYAKDENGEMLFRNSKALEIKGFTEDGSIKESAEKMDFYRKREQSVIKSGKLLEIAAEEYFSAEGKKYSIRTIKVPVFTKDSKPLMVITIGEDVTEAKEKEQQVMRSSSFLQEVLDNLPVALFAKDYGGRYILWNKKSEEVFGKPAGEVIGKTHHNDEINSEQEEFIRTQDQKVFDLGKELDIPQELISTQKEGIKIMHTVKTPLFNEDGTPNCLLAISEDITAKTKMEKQVYESKTKYSLLVENSREGILLIEQGKITFANKTLLTALNYGEEELAGKKFQDLVAKESKEIAEEFYKKVESGTAARDYSVIKMHNKNQDEVVEFEVSAAVSKYLGKKNLIMFLRNITKERSMEYTVKTKDNKFREVFEGSSTPFVILQNNGYIYEMNRAARDLFAFTREDKDLYSSIYIKPGLPLSARNAIKKMDSCMFESKVNFDKLKSTLPGIVKNGSVDLKVNMTPINEREMANGKVYADYLLELSLKGINGSGETNHDREAITSGDILSYQDAVMLCSREGLVVKCNVQFEQLTNLTLEQILGKPITNLFAEADHGIIESDIKELYSQGTIKSRDYHLKYEDGSIPVEATAVLAKGNNFLISLRNTTARKQLTNLLKERSEHLEALSQVIDGALLECDVENGTFSNFTKVNMQALNVTGLTTQELMSMSLADALMDDRGKEKDKVASFLAGKAQKLKEHKVISFEARLQFKDNLLFASVRISGYDFLGKQKAVIILRDTSREKILESELNYKQKELAGIKEALPGVYLKVDKDGIIQEYKTTDMRYNIAVFPTDFVGRKPNAYLDRNTVEGYLENIDEVLKTQIPLHTSFSMQEGSEYKFYEATISPIKGEDNVIVLVNSVDRRKGLENKIHDLYALSSNREANFVKNMDDILEFGKQIFAADVGLIMHFSGSRREKILINYATENNYQIVKGIETPVEECLKGVRGGQIFACDDTSLLPCENCLHVQKKITSMLCAPLYLAGKVEGAICFLTVAPNRMNITEDDRDFIGFIGGLMGMALELRQAKKAVDSGLSTLKKLISTLDTPAIIIDSSFQIKNANEMLFNICGIYDIVELEDKNFFTKLTPDAYKAEGDFRSAYRTSKGGVFDIGINILLSDNRPFNLLWHVVEIRDSKSKVRGFLLVSESIKDIAMLKNYMRGPSSHI